jgi:AcrR family transcriptional regulator
MGNRNAILENAIHLFNENGTAKITTNHIAKEAGISPGNLYYHFEGKEHIIRAIYEQVILDWDQEYDRLERSSLNVLDALREFIRHNFELLWKYRFFSRETVALINADPELKKRHIEVSQKRYERQMNMLHSQFGKSETSSQPDADMLTIAWVTANHYLNYLESMGRVVEQADFILGADLVMKIIGPIMETRNDRTYD